MCGGVTPSGLTVNQPPHGFEGSSPSFPTTLRPCGLRVAQPLSGHPPSRLALTAVIPRHRVSPSASPMTDSSGVSSTPRPFDRFPSQASLEYSVARSSRAMTVRAWRASRHRHCERKRSNPWGRAKKEWIASSLSLLAMTTNINSRSRGAIRPRFARTIRPKKTEGAGNAGCPMHPQME